MSRESAAAKAGRLLAEGRVILVEVAAGTCTATVRGSRTVHHVVFAAGEWTCTCPSRTPSCSHRRAVRRVVAVDLLPQVAS